MADETQKRPLSAAQSNEEQDLLFRAQMGAAQVVLGYWRHALAVIGVVLVVVFFYGLYQDYTTGQQEEWQAAIASAEVKLPEPDPLSRYGLAPMDDPNNAERMGKLQEGARAFEAIGADATGPAAALAWLRAAETWERAGKPDEAMAAYEKAHALGAKGALGWAARSGLAASRAARGDVDGAAALYREAANGKDFYAERALYELGMLYASADRDTDAGRAFEEFRSRFADSTLADEVASAMGGLGGGNP